MHLSTLKAMAMLALTCPLASAYVVTLYSGVACDGDSMDNNVWDNSCSTPTFGFQSFMPQAYGSPQQKANFFTASSCGLNWLQLFWADGGDPEFQVGLCFTFGEGHYANAMGSWRLAGEGREDDCEEGREEGYEEAGEEAGEE